MKKKPTKPKFKEPKAKKQHPKLQAGHAPVDDVVKNPPDLYPDHGHESKPIQLRLPVVIPDAPPLAPVVVVPVPFEPEKVKPLENASRKVRVIITGIVGWAENYAVIVAKDGRPILESSEGVIEADLMLLPPGE